MGEDTAHSTFLCVSCPTVCLCVCLFVCNILLDTLVNCEISIIYLMRLYTKLQLNILVGSVIYRLYIIVITVIVVIIVIVIITITINHYYYHYYYYDRLDW